MEVSVVKAEVSTWLGCGAQFGSPGVALRVFIDVMNIYNRLVLSKGDYPPL